MKNTYKELVVKTNNVAFISDFVFAFDIDALEEQNDCLIIRSEDSLDALVFALDELKKRLEDAQIHIQLDYELTEKENKDWIAEYKNNIQPIQIGDFYIHTSWQEKHPNLKNILIDPALAFGSGHHESTNACVQAISEFAKGRKTALDVGCGSGILSLVLAHLGLAVDACDTDELAILSTKSNFALNNLELAHIWQGSANLATQKYDLVVANLIADVISIIKNDLLAAMAPSGVLILSGILNTYEQRIKSQFENLSLIKEIRLADWLTLVYEAN